MPLCLPCVQSIILYDLNSNFFVTFTCILLWKIRGPACKGTTDFRIKKPSCFSSYSGRGPVCSGQPAAATADHNNSWRPPPPVPAEQSGEAAAHLPAEAAALASQDCGSHGWGDEASENRFCRAVLQKALPYCLLAPGEPMQCHAGERNLNICTKCSSASPCR
jgi:hypothetical protein